MRKQKKQYYEQRIIDLLLENEIITTKIVAEDLQLSEKTCRNKIDSLNNEIQELKLGEIKKKPRVGMWLEATEGQKQLLREYSQKLNSEHITKRADDSLSVALKAIINVAMEKPIKAIDIAEELYVSLPTAHKIIKECEDWLQLFGIKVEFVRNVGIELTYTEEQLRFAIKHYIYTFEDRDDIESALSYFVPGLDIKKLREAIIETENEWGLDFADYSFGELLIYSSVAVYRQIRGFAKEMTISDEERKQIEEYSEFSFSESVLRRCSNIFGVKIPSMEHVFLAIQILCSRIIDLDYRNNSGELFRVYDNKLKEFVERMIEVVSNVLDVDLTDDERLYYGLLLHIRPTIFRLRYEKRYNNEMHDYIKNEYKQTYRVLWIISVLFDEYYGIQVSSNEISLITLYIQSALERREQQLKSVFVSQEGMAFNQLMIEKIKQYCSMISEITVISSHDFNIYDYKDVQVIITTIDLDVDDERIIKVSPFLNEGSLRDLRRKIREIGKNRIEYSVFDRICHAFFEPDLIFTQLDVDNKEQAIEILCNQLVRKGYVTQNYYDTVIDREKTISTSIGNKVAIPHGDQNQINEGKVVIATLKKPIEWSEEDEVDVIFLLAVRMKTGFEVKKTQLFYKQYIKLVETDSSVDILRKFSSSIDLYRYLIR